VEFKITETKQEVNGEIVHALGDGSIVIRINQKDFKVQLIKSGTDEVEFFFENSFHYAKNIHAASSEILIALDGLPITMKKHFKLAELIRDTSSSKVTTESNNLISQIPGRVVNILSNTGEAVKTGDSIVILESMKMQVAVKSHKEGTIRDILVKKGDTVSRNDVIAIIE
jgi:biotin carboxyl carrier protein